MTVPSIRSIVSVLAAGVAGVLLNGCGVGVQVPTSSGALTPAVITGSVHGGQQPIAGAHVYLIGVSSDNSTNGGYKAYDMLGNAGPGSSQINKQTSYSNPAGFSADSSDPTC